MNQPSSGVEPWRTVFRDGIAPSLSTPGLVALRDALTSDDPTLTQGSTTVPPPLMCVYDWPCEGACLIGFAGWKGEGLTRVGEVEEHFARVCYDSDQRTGGPADCRWLLNYWDNTPREQAIRELLPEVELALAARMSGQRVEDDGPLKLDPELELALGASSQDTTEQGKACRGEAGRGAA